MSTQLTAFISGPITGVPNFKAVFDTAERCLAEAGYKPINPTDFPPMMEWGNAMIACLATIHDVDILVDLPRWADSPGSHIEHIYAKKLGKPVMTLDEALEAAQKTHQTR